MEKKYLLSDQYDELSIDLAEIQEYLATEKGMSGDLDKTHYLMGVSSPLLSVATLGLYDQEDIMKKYPNGVVTESFVLIPAEQFKAVKEQATDNNQNYYYKKFATGNFALFLNEYMMNFLEVSLNIELPQNEKDNLEDNLVKSLSRQTRILTTKEMIHNTADRQVIKFAEKPEKTTNRELLKLIEGKGYFIEEKLKNAVNIEEEVKEILKNNESYIKNIEVLENKIKEVSIKEVNEKISLEEFSEMIEKTFEGNLSKLAPLKIVNKKINNLIKKYDLDVEGFIQASKEELFPFMLKLQPLQFKLSMEHVYKEVFYSNAKDANRKPRFDGKDITDFKRDFAVELAKGCNEPQREYLITVITGFDVLNTNSLSLTSERKLRFN